jgi:hypothetical protein
MRNLKELESWFDEVVVIDDEHEKKAMLENVEPVHGLPRKHCYNMRFEKILKTVLEGKGNELPPILVYNGCRAITGCHRHHVALYAIELFDNGKISEIPILPPIVVVSDNIQFELLTGIENNLYEKQEHFHKILVRNGFYTKRIINRRINDLKGV